MLHYAAWNISYIILPSNIYMKSLPPQNCLKFPHCHLNTPHYCLYFVPLQNTLYF